ncbi:hypothetical protein ACFPK5_36585 [Streptomyces beijiangensis]|uniref:hypothetical protein n=1 Tax=Streptomyces beijiangensis TaxID=163361 RepID=UPI00360F2F3B
MVQSEEYADARDLTGYHSTDAIGSAGLGITRSCGHASLGLTGFTAYSEIHPRPSRFL